jgi:outer membrane protein TolC
MQPLRHRFGIAILIFATSAQAQAPSTLTLPQAVELATRNYPSVHAATAEAAAAMSGIGLARTAYLPRADLYSQFNRATCNNVFGLIFPSSVMPAISGPVREDSTITSTWGSAAGLLFSWEPFDFGLRRANVELSRTLEKKAQAGVAVTQYEVALAVIDVFLRALAAGQAVAAAQANVDRLEIFRQAVSALVKSELRPGADESRALAELTRARTELIAAVSQEQETRAALAEWIGAAPARLDPGPLLGEAPVQLPAADVAQHPLARQQSTALEVVRARQRSIDQRYRPRFEILSAVYGRGAGANLDGTFDGGANGLAPSTGNWAAGLSVKFPLFDYKEKQVLREIESHHESAEAARLGALLQHLRTQTDQARIQIDAARRIAANTPLQLEAARTLDTQAQARYRAGLGTVVEVADAQRLLRQAETDGALARLGVWRALFGLAAAEGDFTELLRLSGSARPNPDSPARQGGDADGKE